MIESSVSSIVCIGVVDGCLGMDRSHQLSRSESRVKSTMSSGDWESLMLGSVSIRQSCWCL